MLERINPGRVHPPAPSYCQVMAAQLRQILANYDEILRELGLSRADFVRRTVYVTDMDEYFTPAVSDQILEFWGQSVFASTLVRVAGLFCAGRPDRDRRRAAPTGRALRRTTRPIAHRQRDGLKRAPGSAGPLCW